MEQGANRPAETWDFGAGDVWYFRPNEGHMIQGLEDGCTFLSGAPIFSSLTTGAHRQSAGGRELSLWPNALWQATTGGALRSTGPSASATGWPLWSPLRTQRMGCWWDTLHKPSIM